MPRDPGHPWRYKLKLSDEAAKTTNPGILQARRYHTQNEFLYDVLYDTQTGLTEGCTMIDQVASSPPRTIPDETAFADLLVPVFRAGRAVYQARSLPQIRQRVQEQPTFLPPEVKRLTDPLRYKVGLERGVHERKIRLVQQVLESSRQDLWTTAQNRVIAASQKNSPKRRDA